MSWLLPICSYVKPPSKTRSTTPNNAETILQNHSLKPNRFASFPETLRNRPYYPDRCFQVRSAHGPNQTIWYHTTCRIAPYRDIPPIAVVWETSRHSFDSSPPSAPPLRCSGAINVDVLTPPCCPRPVSKGIRHMEYQEARGPYRSCRCSNSPRSNSSRGAVDFVLP
jgi:hypothetical protein